MSKLHRPARSLLLLSLLACLPLLLYMLMGAHARLIHDDFGTAAIGLKKGAWGGFVYYFLGWTSAYTSVLFRTALAPYALHMPALVAASGLVISWVSGAWLIQRFFPIIRHKRILSIALAALVAAAAVNAFYTPASLYWYAASIQYTFPLACFVAVCVLATWTVDNFHHTAVRWLATLACAIASFITAGGAEMYLVFQLALLSLLAPLGIAFAGKSRRRQVAIVLGAMSLATVLSLLVQLSSPGIYRRMEATAINYHPPVREAAAFIDITTRRIFHSIGHPEAVAGFVLLAAVGMLVAQICPRPAPAPRDHHAVQRALRLGLAAQVLLAPFIYLHQSENPLIFGRYSPAYALVIANHLLLLLGMAWSYWQRQRLQALLARNPGQLYTATALLLLLALLQCLPAQLRTIDARAASILFLSMLSLLLVIAMLWRRAAPGRACDTWVLRALAATATGWWAIVALTIVTYIGTGLYAPRIMAGAAALQVLAGLFWGYALGMQLRASPPDANTKRWQRALLTGSLLVALLIGGGIFISQLRFLPHLQVYAHSWDARHADILAQRAEGKRDIVVAPLDYDVAKLIGAGTLRYANLYYAVDAITESTSEA